MMNENDVRTMVKIAQPNMTDLEKEALVQQLYGIGKGLGKLWGAGAKAVGEAGGVGKALKGAWEKGLGATGKGAKETFMGGYTPAAEHAMSFAKKAPKMKGSQGAAGGAGHWLQQQGAMMQGLSKAPTK
jgi:hypothetical protein